MRAYHGDPAIKAEYLARVAAHRAADELLQGYAYWRDGKGCAVGCTIHSDDHARYETALGIPRMLACLEDAIFEGLPQAAARAWPERFLAAIEPGTDLSRVGWQLLRWLLTDPGINPGIEHPLVAEAVRQCAAVLESPCAGRPIDVSAPYAARIAARIAARSASYAARSAPYAARIAAESASYAADAAWSAAESAAWQMIGDKLIGLLTAATMARH